VIDLEMKSTPGKKNISTVGCKHMKPIKSISRPQQSKPIKTLFVIPSLIRGGAEIQAVNLVNGLDPKKFEKYLFAFEQRLDQIDRVERGHVNFYHQARRHKLDLAPAFKLAQLIDKHEIEVVHCSMQLALFFVWLALYISRRKPSLIVVLHNFGNISFKDKVFNHIIYQWLLRRCEKIIFVCESQRSHWQNLYSIQREKTAVIYNGIDKFIFNRNAIGNAGSDLRKMLGITDSAFVVACLSNIRPFKGHTILINAIEMVIKNRPDTYLCLLGDGTLRQDIEQMVVEKGLASHVYFLGSVSDVRPVLAASNCSVIASIYEAFSMSMLESFSMGVPIVATDTGGTSEALKDGENGFLVKVNDVAQLAAAILRMIDYPEDRETMGKKGRMLIENKFSNQFMIKNTAQIISSVAYSDHFKE
jgi:glycosyltransferase involved in cell wall biosynthesis